MPVAIPIMVALAAYSANEQHHAAKDQQRASRVERRMAAAQNLRERKQAYRQMIVQGAQMQAAATNLGSAQSSGAQGGLAALGSSTFSNVGFQSQMEQANASRLSFLDMSARHITNSNIAQTASNVTSTASQFYSGGVKPAGTSAMDTSGAVRFTQPTSFSTSSRPIG